MKLAEFLRVPGFDGYLVNTEGAIVSVRSGRARLLAKRLNDSGYPTVSIRRPTGSRGAVEVHTLVALAFLGPRPAGMWVRHLNGDATDSRAANLAYGTPRQNNLDTVAHGRHVWANRTHCPKGHEYSTQNTYVDPNGGRRCIACIRAQAREWKRSNRCA